MIKSLTFLVQLPIQLYRSFSWYTIYEKLLKASDVAIIRVNLNLKSKQIWFSLSASKQRALHYLQEPFKMGSFCFRVWEARMPPALKGAFR